jgi:hypothetical protein
MLVRHQGQFLSPPLFKSACEPDISCMRVMTKKAFSMEAYGFRQG